ncbi:MAG: hypothetical protein EXX96DRAFT_259630 [Benjaminiella poitrasii]|nr:MAG: hypothetical protein EXX96DRAFT_259630 [Benjaminiella poitrasii]
MSNEFLIRNRLSSRNSNSSKHSLRYGQPIIGHEFAANIDIANLAIQSSNAEYAARPVTPPTAESIDDEETKTRRRVTFNLNDIQVQTIPTNDDDSSVSSLSLIDSSDEEEPAELASSPSSPLHAPPIPERISKKASYDALQQRQASRRRDQHKCPLTAKPGYWYPLNPTGSSSTSLSSTSANDIIRHTGSPLPTLRSLEMTERLIHESIQREMALNPHLSSNQRRSSEPSSLATTTLPTDVSHRTVRGNMLISDSEEEEDDDDGDEIFSVTDYEQPKQQIDIDNLRHLPQQNMSYMQFNHARQLSIDNSISSMYMDDSTDTSVTTSSPQPPPLDDDDDVMMLFGKRRQEKEELETDFSKSIYNELARRHNQEVIPYTEYQPPRLTFPFEQTLIPVSAEHEAHITTWQQQQQPLITTVTNKQSPKPDLVSSVCIVTSPTIANTITTSEATHPTLERPKNHFFFVKVLKAENLDFPIDDDYTNIFCNIQYKNNESKSYDQRMAHTIELNHEMRIEDIDLEEQIVITIHVADDYKRTNQVSNTWYQKLKSVSDLDRYVHPRDGSICQTVFSPSQFTSKQEGVEHMATLMLVNNWYKAHQVSSSSTPSLLLGRRTSSIIRRKSTISSSTMTAREKAVGKLYIECLCVTTYGQYVPRDIEEVVEALNARRFYKTDWQTGYLTQFGGNAKVRAKR